MVLGVLILALAFGLFMLVGWVLSHLFVDTEPTDNAQPA